MLAQTSSIELFKKYMNPVFIETGSYYGDSIQMALDAGFKIIYSIELDASLYNHCVTRFEKKDNVHLMFGDSHLLLKELLSKIDDPVTFWLDGHWAGVGTAMGRYESPLMQELDIIKDHHIKTHSILIDDIRCWKVAEQGFDVNMIKDKCLQINPQYKIIFEDGYVPNDILVAKI